MMPVNHEAFLTMREYLKLGAKGKTVNQYGTKFYVHAVDMRKRSCAVLISTAHLLKMVSMRCVLCLDS
jgi:hypothetical protein